MATLSLGVSVAASWIVFGGTAAWDGPDRVLERAWPAIYASQAILAAAVGAWVGRRTAGVAGIAAMVIAAWLGELVALTLLGNLLANEIDPDVAWVYWWMATGGPLQPAAAILGGLIGHLAGRPATGSADRAAARGRRIG